MISGSDAVPRPMAGDALSGGSWACSRSAAMVLVSRVLLATADQVAVVACRKVVVEEVVEGRKSNLDKQKKYSVTSLTTQHWDRCQINFVR